jgi:hypothetical protein
MIWLNPTVFRDLEAAKANPAHLDQPDDACDGCGSDLGDTAYQVRDQLLGECCVQPQGRCDQCGLHECTCP